MRDPKNFLRLLSAALLILFGLSFAFAAESQELPFRGEWVGDATFTNIKGRSTTEPLEVIFLVAENPPALKSVSFMRGDFRKETTTHFEVDGAKLKFWVGPKDDSGKGKQLCDLELKDGVLKGTLIGPTPAGPQLKREIVLRRK